MTECVKWIHRLNFPMVVVSITVAVVNHRVGAYLLLCVAFSLLVGGGVLLCDLQGSARSASGRHRFLRPWGQESELAWRLWGIGMMGEAAFLLAADTLSGHLRA